MLTKKQYKLFSYLKDAMSEKPVCPSFEEMRIAMEVKSKSTIFATLNRLEEKGFIRKLPQKARAIELLK